MADSDENDVIIEADGSEELGGPRKDPTDKLAKLKSELEQVKKEKQEYLDGWQRAKADYVNALKRFEEEKTSAQARGTAKAARAFIGVLDSLDRAEAAAEVPDSFKAIAKQLHDAAASLGLEKFGAVGEPFDPMLHEAIGQDAVDSAEADDTVTAVLEPGWRAADAIIRPAKVRVGSYIA